MKRLSADNTAMTTSREPVFFYGWMIVGTSFLLALLSMGIQGSFGNFIKPMSAEFGWDRATATLPVVVATFMSGVFQPIVGRLVDRYGPRRLITIGVIILAASLVSVAWTQNIWYFTGVYGVLFALATSCAGGIPNSTLNSHWFARLRGRALGISSAGGGVGQMLIIPASMLLMMQTDWRTTHLILGGLVLVIGLPITVLILRNDPRELGLLPDGDPPLAANEETGEPATPQAPVRAPLEPEKWHGVFASSPFWLLVGGFFVCGCSVIMVQTHFVPFATDRGISPHVATNALGLLHGVNIVGLLLGGMISDRVGRKIPLAIIYFVRALAIGLLLVADTPLMFYVFAIVAGLSWFSSVPLTIALTGEIYGLRHMGTLVGFVFLSHQIGGAASTYLAGWLFDVSGSYNGVFLAVIGLLLFASAVSWAVQERRYSLKFQTAAAG
ncbi:MFS transporter [Candidatus Entotheonella palauensis]|uniref:Major facilitator superfamily (MFS) profile domain-containing protein n=1 Tax=Candidatus Entotheonella gemina TaxID=1429439 RepID=W4LVA6_9BACT|nr:MFS transporter [Candidatus Entotheonella palauensis]ETX01823.1 MAG: hypothetical protein ETSY2_36590 [Candidatus Entotheonella gemina]